MVSCRKPITHDSNFVFRLTFFSCYLGMLISDVSGPLLYILCKSLLEWHSLFQERLPFEQHSRKLLLVLSSGLIIRVTQYFRECFSEFQ